MGGAFGTNGRQERRGDTGVSWVVNLGERGHLEDLAVDGKIT
jgi:allantoicase